MEWFDYILILFPLITSIVISRRSVVRFIGENVSDWLFFLSVITPFSMFLYHTFRVRRLVKFHCRVKDEDKLKYEFLKPSEISFGIPKRKALRDLKYWGGIAIRLSNNASNQNWVCYDARFWLPDIIYKFDKEDYISVEDWEKINGILFYFREGHHLGDYERMSGAMLLIPIFLSFLIGGILLNIFSRDSSILRILTGLIYFMLIPLWALIAEGSEQIFKSNWKMHKPSYYLGFLIPCLINIIVGIF